MTRMRSSFAVAVVMALGAATSSCGKDATGPAAFRLRFLVQPAASVAGVAQTVEVELLDDDGNRMTTARDRITLQLAGNSTVRWFANAAGGVATFDEVIIEKADGAHTLAASLAQLTAVSLPFSVSPASPSAEHTTLDDDGTEFESNTPFDVTVTVRDVFGNGVAGVQVSVTAPGATFTPASGTSGPGGAFVTSVRASPGELRVTANVAGGSKQLTPVLAIADACAPITLVVPGSASGTMAAGAGCIADQRATKIYTFTVTQQGGVTFAITPGFEATYEVRYEANRPQIAFRTETAASQEWLLLPGTYQFRVGAVSGAGNYSFSTTTGPGNTGQDWKVLVRPGTYTGQALTTADLYDGTWYSDLFLIGDIRPCTITVASSAFEPYLQLFDVLTGGLVGKGEGGTDARAVRNSCLTIPSQIPIMISPTSLFADELGPYTLTIEFTGGAEPAIAPAPIRAESIQRSAASAPIRGLPRKSANQQ